MSDGGRMVHAGVTSLVIKAFFDVYNELGFGFLGSVYKRAMRIGISGNGLKVEAEVPMTVFFRGVNVGDFRADLVVEQRVIVEIKSARIFIPHTSGNPATISKQAICTSLCS